MGVDDDVWRAAAPRVVAALTRRFGDADRAQDAVQEALLAAARQWPRDGVPDDPQAWLTVVAGRRYVDALRADTAREQRQLLLARQTPAPPVGPGADDAAAVSAGGRGGDVDDSVAMLLLCCHPALPRPARVALTLRAVTGLTTAQIARAFLVPEPTMAQRISRAKARLRDAGVRLGEVGAAELPARVDAVTDVLYLLFTEGHASTSGPGLYDVRLGDEAIRLARELHARLPDAGEVTGLLALMLLTDARRAARLDGSGALVPLAEQDRSRWDAALVAEGIGLVEQVLPHGRVGPYQLQAAIAAVHAESSGAVDDDRDDGGRDDGRDASGHGTDWAQVVVLYDMLHALTPTPVVALNRAVAVAMAHGPDAGLGQLTPLLGDPALRRSHRLHAVHAHLLDLAGRRAEAATHYATAARLTTSIPEQRYLNGRAAAARSAADAAPGDGPD